MKHELIKASALKRREYLEEADKTILKNLEKKVEHLAEKVDESTRTNIELQEKIAELMIHLTGLIENLQNMSGMINTTNYGFAQDKFTKGENEIAKFEDEYENEEPESLKTKNVSEQLKVLAVQNKELTKTLRALEKQLKKGSVRDAIKKALEKVKH